MAVFKQDGSLIYKGYRTFKKPEWNSEMIFVNLGDADKFQTHTFVAGRNVTKEFLSTIAEDSRVMATLEPNTTSRTNFNLINMQVTK